jgi:hypothetical protein
MLNILNEYIDEVIVVHQKKWFHSGDSSKGPIRNPRVQFIECGRYPPSIRFMFNLAKYLADASDTTIICNEDIHFGSSLIWLLPPPTKLGYLSPTTQATHTKDAWVFFGTNIPELKTGMIPMNVGETATTIDRALGAHKYTAEPCAGLGVYADRRFMQYIPKLRVISSHV